MRRNKTKTTKGAKPMKQALTKTIKLVKQTKDNIINSVKKLSGKVSDLLSKHRAKNLRISLNLTPTKPTNKK